MLFFLEKCWIPLCPTTLSSFLTKKQATLFLIKCCIRLRLKNGLESKYSFQYNYFLNIGTYKYVFN